MTKTKAVLIGLFTSIISFNSKAEIYTHTSLADFSADVKLQNFSTSERTKIRSAVELIKKVIISDEFKDAILNYQFAGKTQFANNKGLSNEEIYNKIIEASERLTPGVDYTMDVSLVAYYLDATQVGYTMSNSPKIYMNRKFFQKQIPTEVTTNIVHEWLHKLGFQHDVSATPSRPYSVPYAVGYLVRDLAKNL